MADRIRGAIDGIDALLAPLDDEALDAALAAGEPDPDQGEGQGCAWCQHDWHGLPCSPPLWSTSLTSFAEEIQTLRGIADMEDLFGEPVNMTVVDRPITWRCRCDSSAAALPDDTWRPPLDIKGDLQDLLASRMARLGWDGYAVLGFIQLQWRRNRSLMEMFDVAMPVFAAALAEDPRARALRLRRQRGTGPDTDVVHQHRPRQHR